MNLFLHRKLHDPASHHSHCYMVHITSDADVDMGGKMKIVMNKKNTEP
jgi:hypothetical protein